MLTNDDTIAAIATPVGPGGIGIVRLSGEQAPAILAALFRRYQDQGPWQSHRLYLGKIIEPTSGALLDEALAVLMRAPHSYTHEQVAELHCHGGAAVLSQVLAACVAAGARLAERGEFTLRAFLNGALSLDQAEAVADLVSSRSARGARMAAAQLTEGIGQKMAPLEQELIDLLAALTVSVDFPDDIDAPTPSMLIPRIEAIQRQSEALLEGAESGRIWREGLVVVLAGASNVGKSSLMNRLLQTERAIVTASPGTTRDIIEEGLNLDGLPLVLCDTAGLREEPALDEAEEIGIARSREAAAAAQLVLIVIDAAVGLDETARELLDQTQGQSRLLLLNKCDLLTGQQLAALRQSLLPLVDQENIAVISAKTGQGLPELLAKIKAKALGAAAETGREPLISNVRHQQALMRADACLTEALDALQQGLPLDLVGIDLENAYQSIGEISGKTVSEEILTNIFANFCVGK